MITVSTAVVDVPSTVRAIRRALGLTQEALARRLGVSFATVNRWEGGHTRPQRAAMETIAALAREVELQPEAVVPKPVAVPEVQQKQVAPNGAGGNATVRQLVERAMREAREEFEEIIARKLAEIMGDR